MRILIASPYLPWPLWSGGNAAQFSTLRCLADDHAFTLVCPVYSQAQRIHACELQEQLSHVRVRAVFCGTKPRPLPIRLARRGLHLARRLLKQPPGHGAEISSVALPFYPFRELPQAFVRVLQEELERGTDLCQAEFAEMLPLGAWFPRELPKLFIQHQIHFIYSQRFLESYGRTTYGEYLDTVMRIQEAAFLRCFDGVIVFSEQDKLALAPYLEASKLSVSPFPIPADVSVATDIPDGFDGRFLFVGSEEHGPNRDALTWLLAEVWPEILRQLPSARLMVVGRWSQSAQASYSTSTPSVCFTGFVDDLSRVLRAGIMLVPLRIGSGIRTKILAALAQGVPVVTTPVGVEGLVIPKECGCLVRSQPPEFADAAVRLAACPQLWRQMASSGLRAVVLRYSAQHVRQQRNRVYASVVAVHRQSPRNRVT